MNLAVGVGSLKCTGAGGRFLSVGSASRLGLLPPAPRGNLRLLWCFFLSFKSISLLVLSCLCIP